MRLLSISFALLITATATAQDMPLHEILKAGEGWRLHSGEMPSRERSRYHTDLKDRSFKLDNEYLAGKEGWYELNEPTCGISTVDGSTFFVADANDRYVWAIRRGDDGSLSGQTADRYCRLRVRGDDRRKKDSPPEALRADPSAMTIDGSNRLYVATNLGIQSFDPTGRLNGVFTAPPGRVTELTFDGNKLYARADGKVYVRIMLAEGAKK